VCRRLGVQAPAAPPTRFSSAAYETVAALVREAETRAVACTDPASRARLARAYGSQWADVGRLIAAQPALGERLSPACGITRGEVLYAVREECARTLSDVLLRRTDAGTAGHPGDAAVAAAIDVMASELQWSAARAAAERAAFAAAFPR
jgi:glycerol-3-phosphate dehydrogenase